MERCTHIVEGSESEEELLGFDLEDIIPRPGPDDSSGSEEELYCLYENDGDGPDGQTYDSKSSDSDSYDSDCIIDYRAVGRARAQFFGSDLSEDELAELELVEARRLQSRIATELSESDFIIALRASERQTTGNQKPDLVSRDVSSLSTRQKLDLMQRESPEFFVLVQDLKSKLHEIDNVLIPILNYFGNTNDMPAPVKFLKKKFLVLTNYCTNITFYLLLKSKRSSVENHPVLKSLYKYRRVMEEIEELDEAMRPKIEKVLMELNDNKNPALEKLVCALKKKNIQNWIERSKKEMMWREAEAYAARPGTSAGTSAENFASTSAGTSEEPSPGTSAGPSPGTSAATSAGTFLGPIPGTSGIHYIKGSGSGTDAGKSGKPDKGKRPISYQMAKNKGLIPRRNKLQRNPRVKNRNKYRKALIKRRGQMRFPRTEIPVYGGEPSGIKSNVTKSIKFK